jgi:hypothetical protein
VGSPDDERYAWAERAEAVWQWTVRGGVRRDQRGRAVVLQEPGRGRVATLWPYSQVLHAAVLLGRVRRDTGWTDDLVRGLDAYQRGPAYSSVRRPRLGPRYYDDNAWVGLALVQRAMFAADSAEGSVETSRRLLGWIRGGEQPGGGIRWRERRTSVNACSTGSAGVLALRLAGVGNGGSRTGEIELGRRCAGFLAGRLRRPDGLVADRVDRGVVEPTVWAYNQGLAVATDVLLGSVNGAPVSRRAVNLAERARDYFGNQDRLWSQPACFVAVWFRMLLLADAATGDDRTRADLLGYLDRAWSDVSADGDVNAWFAAGVGTYGRDRTLDTAALVQMAALAALPPDDLAMLC